MEQEAMENFCDHYCKYPDTWDEEKEGVPLSDSDICEKCPLGKLKKVPAVNQEQKQPAEDWNRVRVKEYRQGQINILKIIEANIQNEIKRIREELKGFNEIWMEEQSSEKSVQNDVR